MGYNLEAAVAASSQQQQQVEQLLGLQAATLQQQLATQAKVSSHLLLPEHHQQLLQAVSGNAAARTSLAQLQLLQVLAACLGLADVQVCLAPSSFEVVRRLTGHGPVPHPVPQQLSSALQAAAPALLSAVSQLPASSLAQPGVPGLLQLLDSKPDLQVGNRGGRMNQTPATNTLTCCVGWMSLWGLAGYRLEYFRGSKLQSGLASPLRQTRAVKLPYVFQQSLTLWSCSVPAGIAESFGGVAC
jgi:hypothetical protein